MKQFFRRLLFWFLVSLVFFVAYFLYVYNDATSISKGFRIDSYPVTKTALLVIDVQEGTTGEFSKDQKYIDQSTELIKQVNASIAIAHESVTPVVYIQQQTENWLLNRLDDYEMAKGSPGVELDGRLLIVSMNQFKKRKSDAFSSHDFDIFLTKMNINRLIITGLDIAYCAYRTSQAALNRGYEVYIVEEAVISESEELKKQKLKELESNGAVLIKLENLAELINK